MPFQKNHRDFRTKEGLERMGRKISKIRKGIKLSDKTKDKIRQANIGKKCSDTTKKKMSKAHEGQIPINNVAGWNKGKVMSEKWRINLSKSHKGKRLGKENTAWKGGVAKQNNLDRKCIEFKLWREKVFKRDKYICRKCKQVGGKLCSHHIEIHKLSKEQKCNVYNATQLYKKRFVKQNGFRWGKKEIKVKTIQEMGEEYLQLFNKLI